MTLTDEELMAQVREGDLRKLALLFERHHRKIYNLFVHLNGDRDLSEDLTQEVFFRILRYRLTYDQTRTFTAWMYQIARNLNSEQHKHKADLRLVSMGSGEEDTPEVEPVSPSMGAEEALGKRQQIGLLKKALGRLPEDKREILLLSRFHNLKYEEIGQILGCELGAVKVRVYRAMRALGQVYLELSGEKAS